MTVYIEKLGKVDDVEIEKSVARGLKEIATKDFLRDVKKILIKPNFLNSLSAEKGVTTDLRLVAALIKIFRMLKKEVIVAEYSIEDTETVFNKLGIYDFEKLGAKVVNLEKDDRILVNSPTAMVLKNFYLPQTVIDSDLIISVPKMKTHAECTVTLGIKNFFGFLNKHDRSISHVKDIDKAIADIFSYFKKNKKMLVFVDAIVALEGKTGPVRGNPIELGLIVAGNDLLSTDIACVKIMDYVPSKVKHINISVNLGLGKPDDVVLGEKIEDVKRNFAMPIEVKNIMRTIRPITKKIFKKIPFMEHDEKCVLCKRCLEMCPKKAIFIENKKIVFDYRKCIGCLVCCEACRYVAINYKIKNNKLYLSLAKVKNLLIG